jgi:hypothetical protein
VTTPYEQLGGSRSWPSWNPEGPVRFSVIVRTQGRRPGSLADALRSLAEQTLVPHEVLVMAHLVENNDEPVELASVRATVSSVDGLPAVVHLVQGGGRSRPLNRGLDLATGDYVCFLDDDDLAYPNWLASFDQVIQAHPLTTPRARTEVQSWATDGSGEPRRPAGSVHEPFAPVFDLLAHVSHNETPICAVALARPVLDTFGLRFDEALPVYEDWDLLMRVAPLTGVHSIDEPTSLYRQLDAGNANEAELPPVWVATHGVVIDRLSARPLLLPAGDARRVAAAHFQPGAGSRHEYDLASAQAMIRPSLLRRLVRKLRASGSRIAGRRR